MTGPRILFAGSSGAGKRTAMAALSEVPLAGAGAEAGVQASGLEVGRLTLADGQVVRLVGLGADGGVDFAWSALARHALGLVLLVDNTAADPLAELALQLEVFWDELPGLPCAIGVTRTEECSAPGLDAYADHLAERGLALPLLRVDPREREDVLLLMQVLLVQIEAMARDVTEASVP